MAETQVIAANADAPVVGPSNRTWAIFWISVLGLFLELMLIRWLSTEIRIFAYLQNTVLVVCFLGLGMGCFTSRRPVSMGQMLLPLLCLTLILSIPISRRGVGRISDLMSVLNDLGIWYSQVSNGLWETSWKVAAGLAMTFLLMVFLWGTFVPVGRLLGRYMDDHPHTIWAYSANIVGSLVGIWLFVALSVFYLPPVAWVLVAGIPLCLFLGHGRQRLVNLALFAGIVAGAWITGREPGALRVSWSPYQKLVLQQTDNKHPKLAGKYLIQVNNVGYQGILDLSAEGRKGQPGQDKLSQYDVPLLFHPHPDRVLIVGAGAGNDVAGALRGGAKHVTAVEIDPAIIAMGRAYHMEKPYQSPRVRLVTDDARSFFATTQEQYDVIIFGLLDSHTTTAMTNARLDHYVYTRESLLRARTLLKEGGVMVLSFEAFKPFIADRMARCIREVFQREPLTFRIPGTNLGWGGVFFVAGDRQVIADSLAGNPVLKQHVNDWQARFPVQPTYSTKVTTDDWPYIYLASPRIPALYYLLAALMIALFVYGNYRLGTSISPLRWDRASWHFFFLGAAFMLLEVQNISKASVALGNTWWVNAVIISGILSMILLANAIAYAFPRIPPLAVGSGLIGTCLALYFFDIAQLAFLPYATKAVLVGLVTTLPMLFSGILFIQSFARVARKDLALGANLFGSLVGALLQSVTFITGIKALLLIVAGLYLAALLVRPRPAQPAESSPAREPEGDAEPAASLVHV
jgi:hypothetical protein